MNLNETLHNASMNNKINKVTIYNTWAKSYDSYVKKKKYTGPKELIEVLTSFIYKQSNKYKLTRFDKVLNDENKGIKILDFACGTGLVGQEIRRKMIIATIDGIDISTNMLKEASEKKCYNKLFKINIQNQKFMPYTKYDYIVSSGVFLEGHLGFDIIPKLILIQKKNGLFLFTVRKTFLDSNYVSFEYNVINNANIIIQQELDIDYLKDVKCKLFILKKII